MREEFKEFPRAITTSFVRGPQILAEFMKSEVFWMHSQDIYIKKESLTAFMQEGQKTAASPKKKQQIIGIIASEAAQWKRTKTRCA